MPFHFLNFNRMPLFNGESHEQARPSFVEQVEAVQMQFQSRAGQQLSFFQAAEVLASIGGKEQWPSATSVPHRAWNVRELKERLRRDEVLLGAQRNKLVTLPTGALQGWVHSCCDIPGQAQAFIDGQAFQAVLKDASTCYVTDDIGRASALRVALEQEKVEVHLQHMDESLSSLLKVYRVLCDQSGALAEPNRLLSIAANDLSKSAKDALLAHLPSSASWSELSAGLSSFETIQVSLQDKPVLKRLLRRMQDLEREVGAYAARSTAVLLVCNPQSPSGRLALELVMHAAQHRMPDRHAHRVYLSVDTLPDEVWPRVQQVAKTHAAGVWTASPFWSGTSQAGQGPKAADHSLVLGAVTAPEAARAFMPHGAGWLATRRLADKMGALLPRQGLHLHRGRVVEFNPLYLSVLCPT